MMYTIDLRIKNKIHFGTEKFIKKKNKKKKRRSGMPSHHALDDFHRAQNHETNI